MMQGNPGSGFVFAKKVKIVSIKENLQIPLAAQSLQW